MTGTINKNRYGIYKADHTRFGGKIYQSDFNTNYRDKDNTNGSIIASRIAADFQWEEKMLRNKKRSEKYGN